MQAADRGVRVPGAARAVPGEQLGDRVRVVGEMLERHRAILDEGDRLPVALHRHHDVEAGLAHLPDLRAARGLGRPRRRRPESRGRPCRRRAARRSAPERVEVLAGEFDQQQAVRRAPGDVGERPPEQRDVGAEHQHVVVDELDRGRPQRHEVPRRLHRRPEATGSGRPPSPGARGSGESRSVTSVESAERALRADEQVGEVRLARAAAHRDCSRRPGAAPSGTCAAISSRSRAASASIRRRGRDPGGAGAPGSGAGRRPKPERARRRPGARSMREHVVDHLAVARASGRRRNCCRPCRRWCSGSRSRARREEQPVRAQRARSDARARSRLGPRRCARRGRALPSAAEMAAASRATRPGADRLAVLRGPAAPRDHRHAVLARRRPGPPPVVPFAGRRRPSGMIW